jgi:alcohol dehydrogenase class IV
VNFSFHTTPTIYSGPGSLARIVDGACSGLGSRVMIVTDPGVAGAGHLERLAEYLGRASVAVRVFDRVIADPPEEIVLEATRMATQHAATGVIGIGGGSVMDVAKVVALLARSGEELQATYGVGQAHGPRLPLALVPTTAGTGSEVTPISILTVGGNEKKGIVSPLLLPDVAVLDATLTVGLPPHVTAATGIDAMVHGIEAFTSANPNNNPVSKAAAKVALNLLGANIGRAHRDGTDLEARSGMLLGAMLAGQAFANSPVAAVHALAYPLGGRFHLPHGLTNALVLPHVMRFNLPSCAAAYAELAPHVAGHLGDVPSDNRAQALIAYLSDLSSRLGLATRLRDVGVAPGDLPVLAADAMRQTRLLVNNPRPLTERDAQAIYEAAW